MFSASPPVVFRLASSADFSSLADLRYRLTTDDVTNLGDHHKAVFLPACHQRLIELDSTASVVHWVAERQGQLISVLSIVMVPKMPAPDDLHGGWGYLTNVYTLAEYRNQGVGSTLLNHARRWASQQPMELLIVWPSDRSVPFYQRAGFTSQHDPLILPLDLPAEPA